MDVNDLNVPAPSAVAVFTSACWQQNRWPEVPLKLVSCEVATRELLARNGVTRYVPEAPRSGLEMVAEVSRAWGCDPPLSGKTVWASLAVDDR
ncbi:hypothetical protein ACGFK1_03550 [Mycobacterium sp. NPDC048908]|uniref:hypothetical protein n=1 Tax=Mycobacterium sp. NPDC048908 TaxID=3364292 RepID=UPI0037202D23